MSEPSVSEKANGAIRSRGSTRGRMISSRVLNGRAVLKPPQRVVCEKDKENVAPADKALKPGRVKTEILADKKKTTRQFGNNLPGLSNTHAVARDSKSLKPLGVGSTGNEKGGIRARAEALHLAASSKDVGTSKAIVCAQTRKAKPPLAKPASGFPRGQPLNRTRSQKRSGRKQSNVTILLKPRLDKSKDGSKNPPKKPSGISGSTAVADPSKHKARHQKAFSSSITARSEKFTRLTRMEMKDEFCMPDIDEGDIDNQLAVAEYVEDIYQFYWYTEARAVLPADYMSNQTEINKRMREVLLNWLFELHLSFRLMQETQFLMTSVIDKFLSLEAIKKQDLQLVGLTAMLIASKYEEIWAPKVSELVSISCNNYTGPEILSMEKLMLKKLKFNLALPTPFVFLKRFLKAAQADKQMELLAFYLVELSLLDYSSLQWKPSMLAASSVYVARQLLRKRPLWTKLLQKHTHYEESHLEGCARMIAAVHKNAGTGTVKTVYSKYSSDRFGGVAKMVFSSSKAPFK